MNKTEKQFVIFLHGFKLIDEMCLCVQKSAFKIDKIKKLQPQRDLLVSGNKQHFVTVWMSVFFFLITAFFIDY